MRSTLVLAVFLSILGSMAAAAPGERADASAPLAGFSRRLVADTVPATLPRGSEVLSVFATVKVTAEVGEDE